ncbi:MAG: alanine--glyoxylate aminotransferase family protein [Elusimicrobia bacterium]|nr:alanine--glyoxylate aminotransferase family protein [Elusimicrobiota bacterium]
MELFFTMKYTLLTPGPTPVPQEILDLMAEPVLHHRTPEFAQILNGIFDDLKYVFQTQSAEVFVLSGSGTAALEAAVVNFFSPGDEAAVVSIGAFGDRWAAMAKTYGLNVTVFKEPLGEAAKPEKIRNYLRSHAKAKGVFVTHAETSTATVNSIRDIARIVQEFQALFLVDAVSSLAGEELRQDDWGLDVVCSASQKGLMCPPGVALLSASTRAMECLASSKIPKFYLDLKEYRKSKSIPETPFTPPVSLLVGLAQALKIIRKDTVEWRWEQQARLAQWTRSACQERLGAELFSQSPANVLTAFSLGRDLPEGFSSTSRILTYLRDHYKITIADGQGELKGKIFRIAHMGAITQQDIENGLSALVEICGNRGHRPIQSAH